LRKNTLGLALIGSLVLGISVRAQAADVKPTMPAPVLFYLGAPPPALDTAIQDMRKACRIWETQLLPADQAGTPAPVRSSGERFICQAAVHPNEVSVNAGLIGGAVTLFALFIAAGVLGALSCIYRSVRDL